jgi:hypothetical protein
VGNAVTNRSTFGGGGRNRRVRHRRCTQRRGEPVATCTSDVVDGVEVDCCVGNPNANIFTNVPGVNVVFELSLGLRILTACDVTSQASCPTVD